jgi:hypothetical protein
MMIGKTKHALSWWNQEAPYYTCRKNITITVSNIKKSRNTGNNIACKTEN